MQKAILFLCVENRARSQMAEGLARRFIGHRYEVLSAGSFPASRIHPMAVAVMAEIGLDISKHTPKTISEIDMSNVALVVLLCSEEQCPNLPTHKPVRKWDIPDPVSDHSPVQEQLKNFRAIRTELHRRILSLGRSESFNG